jgi:AdoMet-dependent heme synthase
MINVLSWPAYLALELTPHCNNRCPGCSNLYAAARGGRPLPAARWRAWLETFAPEAVQLRLTGGEPTLHPEFFAILDAATGYDARVTVFTNGRWADPPLMVRRLGGRPQLSGLLVSLHGPDAASHEAFSRAPGSFGETVENIRRAVGAGIPVSLSTVLTRHNWDRTGDMATFGQELGAAHVAFNRYLGELRPELEASPAQLREAVASISRLAREGAPLRFGVGIPQCFTPNPSEGCLAGAAYAALDPWGRLRPCSHSPTVIGSLEQYSLYDLWHSPAMDAWRGLLPAECPACAAFSVCHGGCRALQELRLGAGDPLRCAPLAGYAPDPVRKSLPGGMRPRLKARLRPELFGYALLGGGSLLPVAAGALPVLSACDGRLSLAEIHAQFGQESLALFGELWERGLVEF